MKREDRFFFFCGLLMLSSEIWKQLTLMFQINHGSYLWWNFPFQLCSIPMYLCVLLPFVRPDALKRSFLTFLMSFGLVGGIFVFFDTSGMHYPLTALTVHSYLWHFLLIAIGIAACRHPALAHTFDEYSGALALYLSCCVTADVLNVVLHPLGTINLFYISPYYHMPQIVFHTIAKAFGDFIGTAVYIGATAAAALSVFLIVRSRYLHARIKRL